MKSIFSSLFYLLFILKCGAQVNKNLEKIKFVFKNDSIIQSVVITFSRETMKMPPLEASKKIYFVINTKNTLRNLECSLSDTAYLKKNRPTSSAVDEIG